MKESERERDVDGERADNANNKSQPQQPRRLYKGIYSHFK